MRKVIALFLAAALSAGVLAGCSGGGDSGGSGSSGGDVTVKKSASDAAGSSSGAQSASATKDLNIFTWDGYFPQDVLDEYTAKTGVKINMSNFESNEEMLTKLEAAGAGDYDVIVASDYIIDVMRKKGGMMKELDKGRLPNLQNIDPYYQSKFYDPENQYTIPYGPGAPVIVYDPAVCNVDIQGYEDLWNPELRESVAVMDSSRVMIGITLKTLGSGFNETDTALLDRAKEKLLQLKPNVRMVAVNNTQDTLLSGEASVGFLYTSQAATALATNPDLKVVYPKEGLGFGIDCLFMPQNAPNEENAYAFLDFIMDGEVAAKIYPQIWYLCPNKAAADLLPEEYKSNPGLYFPSELLENAEIVQDMGELNETYEKIWTEFKQQ